MKETLICSLEKHNIYYLSDANVSFYILVPYKEYDNTNISIRLKSNYDSYDLTKNSLEVVTNELINYYKNLDNYNITLILPVFYNNILDSFKDKSHNRTPKNLKELVKQYRESQMDLLQDSSDKRTRVAECRSRLRSMMFKLEDYEYYKEIFPPEKILEEIKSIYEDLEMCAEKYDYSKLPDDRINL